MENVEICVHTELYHEKKWNGIELMYMNEIVDNMFPQHTSLPRNDFYKSLDNLCLKCFNNITFLSEEDHLKKCKPKKLSHVHLGSKLCYCLYFNF